MHLDDVVQLVADSPRVVIGGAPGCDGAARLDLSGLSGPVEINPENLSATFLAGTSMADVDAALAPHGLWWPVDAAPGRQLGAVLATGGPYPGRTGYGYVRDWVLGLEVVLAGGERMQLGGQTMKNVAGYDLTRLFVGSRGTLGAIVAATLRLRPRPERMLTLRLPRDSYSLAAGLAAACEWDGGQLLVRLDGREGQVERRLAELGPGAEPLSEEAAAGAWAAWYERERNDAPPTYSPLAAKIREAIAPGKCFNPTL